MHNIEMHEMTEAFFPCWKAAGIHLSKQVDGGIQSWLRAHPYLRESDATPLPTFATIAERVRNCCMAAIAACNP